MPAGTFWLDQDADSAETWASMCRRSMAACLLAQDEGILFRMAEEIIDDRHDPRSGRFLDLAEMALEHLAYLPPRPTP